MMTFIKSVGRKIGVKFLSAVIIVLLVVVGFLTFSIRQQKGTTTVISTLIGNRLEAAQELVTAKYYYTNAATVQNSKDIFGVTLPFSRKQLVVTYEGVLSAGVDLKEVKIAVNQTKKTIQVTLPDAKILSNALDEDSVKILDETSGLFNKLNIEDYTNLRKKEKNAIEKKVTDSGFLKTAKDYSQQAITTFLNSDDTIKTQYTITFK